MSDSLKETAAKSMFWAVGGKVFDARDPVRNIAGSCTNSIP